MNKEKVKEINAAIILARRFIRQAEIAKTDYTNDEMASITGTPNTATLKRSSMDLTRGLADLRMNRSVTRWL